MDLYDAIYARKSLRKYSMMSLEEEMVEKIKSMMNDLPALDEFSTFKMRFVEDGNVFSQKMSSLGKVSAPHYIVVTGIRTDIHLISAGYSIEHFVLKLTSMGIGTCYIGHALDKATATKVLGLEPDEDVLITIALGYAMVKGKELQGPRDGRKREPLGSLILEGLPNPNQRKILEAARIGPSYMNSQRWRFTIIDDEIRLHKKALDFIRARFLGLSGYFDMGIALCHLEIASKYEGYKTKILYDDSVTPHGEYIKTLKLEK